MAVAAIFSFVLCLALSLSRSGNFPQYAFVPRLIFFGLAGCVVGALAASSTRAERLPVSSAVPRAIVSEVTILLTTDPVPWGTSAYRAQGDVLSVGDGAGRRSSARGRIAISLPPEIARAYSPGATRGAATPELISAGSIVTVLGTFEKFKPRTGDVFRVASVLGPSSWATPFARFRARSRLALSRVLYDWGEAGGLLLALISANRDYLEPSTAEGFRRAGLAHVLALSGMHLSLVGLLARSLAGRLGGKKAGTLFALLSMAAFVWFAGASPSLVRALIMAVLSATLAAASLRVDLASIIACSCLIQLLIRPGDATSLAFALSYAAIFGIATVGERLAESFPPCLRNGLGSALAASFAAQIATAPIVAVSLATLTPIGVLSSCAVTPVASLFLVAGSCLAALSMAFGAIRNPCVAVARVLYETISHLVAAFALIPPLPLRTAAATITACVVSTVFAFVFFFASVRIRSRRSFDDRFAGL